MMGSVGVSDPPAFSMVTPNPDAFTPAGAWARIKAAFPDGSGLKVPAGRGLLPPGRRIHNSYVFPAGKG